MLFIVYILVLATCQSTIAHSHSNSNETNSGEEDGGDAISSAVVLRGVAALGLIDHIGKSIDQAHQAREHDDSDSKDVSRQSEESDDLDDNAHSTSDATSSTTLIPIPTLPPIPVPTPTSQLTTTTTSLPDSTVTTTSTTTTTSTSSRHSSAGFTNGFASNGSDAWDGWFNRGDDNFQAVGRHSGLPKPPEDANNFSAQAKVPVDGKSSNSLHADCPDNCGKPPGSSKCLCYDRRIQADSWEEALINFADMTDELHRTANESPCRRFILASLFNQSGISQSLRNTLLVNDHSPVPKGTECQKYQDTPAEAPVPVDKEKERLSRLAGLCLSRVHVPRVTRDVSERDIILDLFRNKREASDIGLYNPTVGERFKISCVDKGQAASDKDDDVALCTRCWAWRKLPDQYYPKFINELVCRKESRQCLGEYGKCTEQTRQVDLFEKTPAGDYKAVSVTISICCDCAISSNSGLKHFISQ